MNFDSSHFPQCSCAVLLHEHFAFRFTKQPAQIAGIRRQSFLLKTFREVSFCNASSFPREFFKCIFPPWPSNPIPIKTKLIQKGARVSGSKGTSRPEKSGRMKQKWNQGNKNQEMAGAKKCQERWKKKEAKLHLLPSLRLARSSSGPLTLFSSSAASLLCFSANFLTALWRFPRTKEGRVENRKKSLAKLFTRKIKNGRTGGRGKK